MKAGEKDQTVFDLLYTGVSRESESGKVSTPVELSQNSPQHQVNVGRVEEQVQTLVFFFSLCVC